MAEPLLEIQNATKVYGGTGFLHRGKTTVALQDFNLTIDAKPATITTIAGESGSGKTTLANLVLGFVKISSGQVRYKGVDVNTMDRAQLFEYRREVQAVFQDPYAVYNPFYRVKHIFDMVLGNFKLARSKSAGRDMIEEALNVVGMRGDEVLEKYPHQLSGGQRQRLYAQTAPDRRRRAGFDGGCFVARHDSRHHAAAAGPAQHLVFVHHPRSVDRLPDRR